MLIIRSVLINTFEASPVSSGFEIYEQITRYIQEIFQSFIKISRKLWTLIKCCQNPKLIFLLE